MNPRLALVLIVMGLAFSWWWFSPLIETAIEYNNQLDNYCQKNDIHPCWSNSVECHTDCNSMNYDFFKYDDGGFGSEECWCKVNNGSMQVW